MTQVRALSIHGIVSVAFVVTAFVAGGKVFAASVAVGCAVTGINLFALLWSWKRIIFKKSIAPAIAVIVLKYAIFGFAIYKLLGMKWVNVTGLVVGLGSIILTVAIIAHFSKRATGELQLRSVE